MPEIKSVIIQMINTGKAMLRRYDVLYYSGTSRIYGVPPDTVLKFIDDNKIEYQKVRYTFKDESEVHNENDR